MTDDLLNKLKGLAKKWHAAYTGAYFAQTSIQLAALAYDAAKDAAKAMLNAEPYTDEVAADPFAEFMEDEDTRGLDEDGFPDPDPFYDDFEYGERDASGLLEDE